MEEKEITLEELRLQLDEIERVFQDTARKILEKASLYREKMEMIEAELLIQSR